MADGGADVDMAVAEVEIGFGLGRQQSRGVLHRFVEAVAEIVVHQIVERLQRFRLFGPAGEGAEEVERFVGLQERQVVPALQVGVEPDGDVEVLFSGAEPGAEAEFGADDVADEAGVERVVVIGFGDDAADGLGDERLGLRADIAEEDGDRLLDAVLRPESSMLFRLRLARKDLSDWMRRRLASASRMKWNHSTPLVKVAKATVFWRAKATDLFVVPKSMPKPGSVCFLRGSLWERTAGG